jgi:hypothetical protein
MDLGDTLQNLMDLWCILLYRCNSHMLLIVSWMAALSVECRLFLPLIIQLDVGPA